MKVVVAVAAHRDEPAVAHTVLVLSDDASALQDVRVVVCVNGPAPRESPAAIQLAEVPGVDVRFLDRASKPAAWNLLRAEPADVTVFCDADVEVVPGSLPALVSALAASPAAVVATAAQSPRPPSSLTGQVAATPFKLGWGGVAGTLYAARTAWLPEMPEDVLLDDGWLWSQASRHGDGGIVHVPEARATFEVATTWRDLWRQRLRAEAGKRQLKSWGLALAPPPAAARPSTSTLRAYPVREWPAVASLAAIKLAANFWSRFRQPEWGSATSTKVPRREALRHVFESAADRYHAARPDYPQDLIDAVADLAALDAGDRILEIGGGTGKATVELARRGLAITSIELGSNLAAAARRNLAEFPDAKVVEAAFETWVPPREASFDAVVAATSWHWIDPEVRCHKAADLLKPGGHLAVWTNNHVFPEGGDSFFEEIQTVYDEIGEGLPSSDTNWPRPGELADHRRELEESGRFEAVEVRHFDWEMTYDADSYIALLDTFSGHIAMEPTKREYLYAHIRKQLAARPSRTLRRHWGAALTVGRRIG